MHRTLAALALCLALAVGAPAGAEENKMSPTLTLSGHGEVRLVPDLASVSVGVLSAAPDAATALADNNRAMGEVLVTLKAAGIAERDIQTSNFSIQPRYDYDRNGQPPELAGYDVSNSLTVTVRKLGGLGAVLDAIVKSGSNQISGIQFGIAKPEAALDEARRLALADAQHKASVYAAAGRFKLGAILALSEGQPYAPPVPVVRGKMMQAEAAGAVPIAGGEQALSIDVNVTWALE
jgi:hypothetical protein